MRRLVLYLVLLLPAHIVGAQTASFPGSSGSIPCAGLTPAANQICARNAGNTAWVYTTNTSGGATTNAGYWLSAPDGGLTSGKDLSALTAGLVLNTAGTPSAYTGSTPCSNQFVRTINANGGTTCGTVSLTTDVSGQLAVGNGGTGLATAPDDALLVGNGTVLQAKAIPDCNAASQALNYATATNTFSCATLATGAGNGNVLGAAASATGELAAFDNTGDGKHLSRTNSLNGVPILFSGVPLMESTTGAGAVVRSINPALNGPFILDFGNSNHLHDSTSHGGLLSLADSFDVAGYGPLPVASGGSGSTSPATGAADATSGVVLSVSPVLRGTPQAPTAAAETNTQQIATTAQVYATYHKVGGIGANELASSGVTGSSCTFCSLIYDVDGRLTGASSNSPIVPGGASTSIQYNDAGTLAGDTGLVYNKTTKELTGLGPLTSAPNAVSGGALTLDEDTDFGTSTWKLDIAGVNLAGPFSISPGTDGKLSGAALLTAASITQAELSSNAKIRSHCVDVSVMGQNVYVWKMPSTGAATAVRFSCVSSGAVTTAPTYTLQECATDGSACANVHASPITCGATEGTTSTFTDSSWAASAWMRVANGNTGIIAGMTKLCADWSPT